LDWAYEAEQAYVDGLSESERVAKGTYRSWSAKDVVAHIAYHKLNMAHVLDKLIAHGVERVDELPTEGIDVINRRAYDRYRDCSWGEVKALSRRAHETIRNRTQEISDEILQDPQCVRFEWNQSHEPVWRLTVYGNAVAHPVGHISRCCVETDRLEHSHALWEAYTAEAERLDSSPEWSANLQAQLKRHYATTPPYPRSETITRLTWAPASTIIRRGVGKGRDGSDNWPLTWADDGHLYCTYGDGYGFDPIVPEKLGLGFARIIGSPPDLAYENIRSDGENKGMGRSGKKGSGLLMVDGRLYLWLFHADERGGQAQLAWSDDRAAHWTFCDWVFAEFGLCTFINYGRNYAGARDEYVYTVTHNGPMADGPADEMILMRVPADRIRERDAFEFYQALDGAGQPVWTPQIEARGAVFRHRDACLRSGISYNAPLRRYLWWQHIPNEPGHQDRGDTRFAGGFGIYEAPEPWGPWRTVYYAREWDVGPGERAEFPPKWMSADGRTLYLIFSGEDNFSIRKATLTVLARSAGSIRRKPDG
jgi:hypothetical protein